MMLKKLMGLASCAALIAFTLAIAAPKPASYFETISFTVAGVGGLDSGLANSPAAIPSANQISLVMVCHIRSWAVRPLSPNWKPSLSWGMAARTLFVLGISLSTP